jgi:DNA-binding CsgD family transcriptional regulator
MPDLWDELTPREREVAVLVGHGLSTGEIAVKLEVTHKTVKNHLYNIYSKLGVVGANGDNRVQLAVWMWRSGRMS